MIQIGQRSLESCAVVVSMAVKEKSCILAYVLSRLAVMPLH